MAQIPLRFKRVAAAFNEAARARLCESSGSEHYFTDTDNSADLSDLINSFMERDFGSYQLGDPQTAHRENDGSSRPKREGIDGYCSQSRNMDMLENLFYGQEEDVDGDDDVAARKKLLAGTELACGVIGDRSSKGFRRRLMSSLRDRGFDAGLCKSRWEKFGRHPAGSYEYVDVNVKGNRYIVEVFLAGEFEIARPTSQYTELLDVFPRVFIGKPEKLKQVVRIMCNAIRESMKSNDMHVPPWRRNGYMQAKWFGHYKRTVNEVPTGKGSLPSPSGIEASSSSAAKRAIGFEALPILRACNCKEAVVSKGGFKVGYLTAAFHANGAIDM